jgi:hypothetical protein
MTATVMGGFGLEVKIDVSATMTAIAQLMDGELPEFEKFIAESTAHNAAGGYATYVATGKRKLNEFKMTLGWDSDDETHAAILTAFASNSPIVLTIYAPDGSDEVISFNAHVNKIGRITAQEDGYKCDVTVQPTAAPTTVTKITFTGKNGAGACTCTGANVGDRVIVITKTAGTYSGDPTVDFEQTITVDDEIQQAAVGNLSGVTFFVKLMPSGT